MGKKNIGGAVLDDLKALPNENEMTQCQKCDHRG